MSKKPRIKTTLYIDGFNLYYGTLKDSPYKWLNPMEMVAKMFPRNHITAVKFCSARVSALPHDPDAPTRQMTYWRALQTIENLEIIEGHFRTRKVRAKVVSPPPNTLEVYKTEEKGSDVNLGAHLLLDAFQNKYDTAILITGDSDLITPVRMVKEQLRKAVGVINPQLGSGSYKRPKLRANAGLRQAASFYRNTLSDNQVKSAQFPEQLSDDRGKFTKPVSW